MFSLHLDFDSLCKIERFALIDSQIMCGRTDAFVPEQMLAGGQVLGLVVDRR